MRRLLLAGLLLVATVPCFGQLDKIKDWALATVSIGYDAAATSITLTTGHGANLLQPSTDGAFYLVWYNSTDYPSVHGDPNKEIVRVTARSGDVLTVTRGQAGTSATTKNTGGKTYKMFQTLVSVNWQSVVDGSIFVETGTGRGVANTGAGGDSILRNPVVTIDELEQLDGVSSNVQTQFTGKQAKATFPVVLGFAMSDETTALTASTSVQKITFRIPFAMTVTAVRASVGTAPTGATILVDIHETGTTILSTKLMIDASEFTSTTATTAYVISDAALADDAEITLFVDQIGSTIAGAGLKLWIIGTRVAP